MAYAKPDVVAHTYIQTNGNANSTVYSRSTDPSRASASNTLQTTGMELGRKASFAFDVTRNARHVLV